MPIRNTSNEAANVSGGSLCWTRRRRQRFEAASCTVLERPLAASGARHFPEQTGEIWTTKRFDKMAPTWPRRAHCRWFGRRQLDDAAPRSLRLDRVLDSQSQDGHYFGRYQVPKRPIQRGAFKPQRAAVAVMWLREPNAMVISVVPMIGKMR